MPGFKMSFDIFAPQSGHTNVYHVSFTDGEARITQGSHMAVCKFSEGNIPEWFGHKDGRLHPLIAIFENDMIYPPSIIPRAIEGAWRKWSEGKATTEEVKDSLVELFRWIDTNSRNKPKSSLWRGIF